MGLFDFLRGPRKHRVSLHSVAKRLKISQISIVSILRDAGFQIYDMPFVILDERHLEILSVKYVDAIKTYHNSSTKNYYNMSSYEQIEIRKFFAKFMNNGFWTSNYVEISSENFFKSKLNSDSIKDFFYTVIENIENEELYGYDFFATENSNSIDNVFNKFLYKIKLKTSKSFNDIKSKLISILTTFKYYIFSDDEDHNAKANVKLCFSALRKMPREALIKINYLKFQIQWKKLSYS